MTVFTPGSRAGTPLALLRSLASATEEDSEDSSARVASTADSLLALAGVTAMDEHRMARLGEYFGRLEADSTGGERRVVGHHTLSE